MLIELCVQDGSEESRLAVAALSQSGIGFHLTSLSSDDVLRDEGRALPRLYSSEGFFNGLKEIEWYAKVYGRGNN
ncbi:hypothetical protein J4218_00500 [Candidatus Pacearchaeota archaeon]|nr:hypothetical protein [Candidatus Pacearchaeota archaeon]